MNDTSPAALTLARKAEGNALANDDIGQEARLELWRLQVEIRDFEKRAYDLFLQNLVKGTSHLSLGQEAIAAGFAVAMKPGDLSFCTYRGHAHTLARGAEMEKVLGELMQRDYGLMRGKGGSMHLTSVEHGVMGSYAIIGAHLCIANGAAWRAQYLGASDVSVCFFGDGTTNIGAFHEALNFAAVWKLPVVFVCENNLYMEYTPIADVIPVAQSGGRPRVGLRAREDHRRRQRRRCGVPLGAHGVRQGAGGRGAVADRVHDLSPLRPFARRPRKIPAAGRAREVDGARSDQGLSRAARRVRRRRRPGRGDREGVEGQGRGGDRDLQGGAAAAGRDSHHRCLCRWRLGMAELTYRDAVARGIAQEMERDERVVFLGEDVGKPGGVFKATVGLYEQFGPKRVRDTPISEQAILGAAMGAAMTGLRPIAEIMFSDFLAVCFDFIANEIPKARYMTNGQTGCPLVVRTGNGAGSRFGAQHSQSVENWAMMIPGLKVVAPSNPVDMIGLMAAAVRDEDPVIMFEHKSLYATKAEVPDGEILDTLGTAKILRQGKDATIVALALMVPRALAAAETLKAAARHRLRGHRRALAGAARYADDPGLGGEDRAAVHGGGESAALRLGRGDRVDRGGRGVLRSRRPDRADHHAAYSAAGGRQSRGHGASHARAHRRQDQPRNELRRQP